MIDCFDRYILRIYQKDQKTSAVEIINLLKTSWTPSWEIKLDKFLSITLCISENTTSYTNDSISATVLFSSPVNIGNSTGKFRIIEDVREKIINLVGFLSVIL